MKKIYHVSLFLILLFGCRKQTEMTVLADNIYLKEQIKAFFDNKLNKATVDNLIRIKEVIDEIKFENIQSDKFAEETDIITAPIENIDVKNFLKVGKTQQTVKVNSVMGSAAETKKSRKSVTKAVFYSKEGKIYDGQIVEICSEDYSSQFIDDNFKSIIQNKVEGFTGNLSINSFTQRLLVDFGFKNGRPVSSTKITRGGNKSSNISLNSMCVDWFATTTFYYTDGSTNSYETYLGRTCAYDPGPGEVQVPQQDQSSGGNTAPAPDTLCAQSKRLSTDTTFITKMDTLTSIASTQNYEAGYVLKTNNNGGFNYTYQQGNPGQMQMNFTFTGSIDGIIHSHYVGCAETITATDIKMIYDVYLLNVMNNMNTFTIGVVLPDGKMQLIRITDSQAFLNFAGINLTNSGFDTWRNLWASGFSMNAGTYEANTKNLLCSLAGSGLTVYESNTITFWLGVSELGMNSTLDTLTKKRCK